MDFLSAAFLVPLLVGISVAAIVVAGAFSAATKLRENARADAEALHDDARQETSALRKKWIRAAEQSRDEILTEVQKRDQELEQREQEADQRDRDLKQLEGDLQRQKQSLQDRSEALKQKEDLVSNLEVKSKEQLQNIEAKLQEVASMTPEEAKQQLIEKVREEAMEDASKLVRKIQDEARNDAERQALRLTVLAMESIPLKTAVEHTISFIQLPSDELKGRIIGREGRNIRAIENATGIDLIVDDTPGAILVSSFDPARRELARLAIERLIEDGRIHPARIEEVVEKVKTEFAEHIEMLGTQAAFQLGISELHPRLARLVGQLKFRSMVGQSLLQHSLEVGFIASYLAESLGLETDTILHASLLHEIGRVDPESSGHPLLASAELAAKFGESTEVVETLQGLHPDVDRPRLESLLVRIANRISENRPGARKDNLEIFIERLSRLEAIANSFEGVDSACAVKSGKELRVLVRTDMIADAGVLDLSRAIARRVERELDFPGQIRVHVIRETRAVEFAI